MKKLKVLVSAYACNPIGSKQLHPGEDITGWELTQQLSRFHNVWVITHSYNREGVENYVKRKHLLGVKFCFIDLPPWLKWLYRFEFGQRVYYYLWQVRAFLVAVQLHRHVRFHLVHHITFNNDWMPSFVGALLPIPFIWGPVGGGQRTPKGFKSGYSLYGHVFDMARLITQWLGRHDPFRRRSLRRARAMLVCNRETKEMVPRKHIDRVHFFPVNGIALEDFGFVRDTTVFHSSFCILTAGRLVHWKVSDLTIKVFEAFHKRFPESCLCIVGDGPESGRLKRLVQKLGLKDTVHFVPWLNRAELLLRMRSCDVFLYTSLREGGGAVVVEAMASGTPVVCLDTAGPSFHIQEEWGIKVPPKNPEYVISEMARALERLYLDGDLRSKMGKAARKRAEEFYLWDRLGEKMQAIYEKALKGCHN